MLDCKTEYYTTLNSQGAGVFKALPPRRGALTSHYHGSGEQGLNQKPDKILGLLFQSPTVGLKSHWNTQIHTCIKPHRTIYASRKGNGKSTYKHENQYKYFLLEKILGEKQTNKQKTPTHYLSWIIKSEQLDGGDHLTKVISLPPGSGRKAPSVFLCKVEQRTSPTLSTCDDSVR